MNLNKRKLVSATDSNIFLFNTSVFLKITGYWWCDKACEVVSAIVYKLTIKHDEIKGLLDIDSSIEIKFFFNVVICIVGEIRKVPIDIRNVWVLASIIYCVRCLL